MFFSFQEHQACTSMRLHLQIRPIRNHSSSQVLAVNAGGYVLPVLRGHGVDRVRRARLAARGTRIHRTSGQPFRLVCCTGR